MDRYLIAFLLVIFCCAINYFSGVPTEKWQQELEMNLGEKINKVEARNVQLEEKVNQLENQLENQRLVNVSLSFIFSSFLLILGLLLGIRIILSIPMNE
jgi:hypothetical protein